jgi:hypothetical protein
LINILPFKINCCIFLKMSSESFTVFHKQNHATHDAVITYPSHCGSCSSHNLTCWCNDTKNDAHKHISSPTVGSAKHRKKWLSVSHQKADRYTSTICLFVCLSLLSCWRNQTDKIYFCQTYLFWKTTFFSGIDFMSEYFPLNWFNFLQTKFYLWQQNKFSTVMSRIQNKSF